MTDLRRETIDWLRTRRAAILQEQERLQQEYARLGYMLTQIGSVDPPAKNWHVYEFSQENNVCRLCCLPGDNPIHVARSHAFEPSHFIPQCSLCKLPQGHPIHVDSIR